MTHRAPRTNGNDEELDPDFLMLLETDREHAALAFRQLSRERQADLIRRAPVEHWYDLITLTEDATQLVQSLSVPELYRLASAEDLDKSALLLATASPDQVRGVMDFSCWRGDRIDRRESVRWLEWLASLPDEAFAERATALDAAFLASVLGPHMTVAAPADFPGEFTVYRTGIYSIPTAFRYDEQLLEWLVQRLYECDRLLYDEVINRIFRDERTHERATHAGLREQLSEAQERRARRLAELRLQDTYGARVDLLRPLEVRIAERGRHFSTVLPESVPRRSLLDRMLRSEQDSNRQETWRGLLGQLVVHVVIARGGDPASPRQMHEAAEATNAALSVALDTLSGGSVFMAGVIGATWEWGDLFRVGHTLLENLRSRTAGLNLDEFRRGPLSKRLRGLQDTPLRVYDASLDGYRLPETIGDILRAMQAIGRAEREREVRRWWEC